MRFQDQLDMSALEAFCRRWQITELSLFGSAVRGDLGPESDVDVLVSFQEGTEPTLFEFSRLARELGELLGREVVVLTPAGWSRAAIPIGVARSSKQRRRSMPRDRDALYDILDAARLVLCFQGPAGQAMRNRKGGR